MKYEIDGNEIRIKGANVGENSHLVIWCSEEDGCDHFSLSIHKDGFKIGCLPMIDMDKRNVIITDHGEKRFVK